MGRADDCIARVWTEAKRKRLRTYRRSSPAAPALSRSWRDGRLGHAVEAEIARPPGLDSTGGAGFSAAGGDRATGSGKSPIGLPAWLKEAIDHGCRPAW